MLFWPSRAQALRRITRGRSSRLRKEGTAVEMQRKCRMVAVMGIALALGAVAADKPVGTTMPRAPVALDSRAMNAMLRADTDKDGYLSREELERYDMTLARRL